MLTTFHLCDIEFMHALKIDVQPALCIVAENDEKKTTKNKNRLAQKKRYYSPSPWPDSSEVGYLSIILPTGGRSCVGDLESQGSSNRSPRIFGIGVYR